MINIGVYNDNTDYIDTDKYKFIKFIGDIELIKKEAESSEILEEYSKTFITDAQRINSIIMNHNKTTNLLIIDGTSSIGGNFLEFIKCFKYNIGIELNKERFIKLNDNIKKINNIKIKEKPYHYKLENSNCNTDCNNCNIDYNSNNKIITINMSFLDNNLLEKIFKLYQNIKIVIFLDPPWGGKEYKNYDKIVFGLDSISLKTIIHTIRKIKKDIDFCIKLPKNYFLESLNGIRYNIYKFKKFIVIYCY
jgi:hypothetical protein